jgi:putative SOS response-associated peptidase YedK
MCYNYEALIRRGVKRAIHEFGEEYVMSNLTDEEKRVLGRPQRERVDGSGVNDEAEKQSTFPGAQVQVIPIDTQQREYYYFGFLPDWATSFNDSRKNFNARSETILEKPTWKDAMRRGNRCLVCATGFFEDDRPNKKRYFFSVRDQSEIFFAGIYNHWLDRLTGELIKTFAIITSEPNELVSQVHNRMPVILDAHEQLA